MANYINSNYSVHKTKCSKRISTVLWCAGWQINNVLFGGMGSRLALLGSILGWILFLVSLFLCGMWLWFVLLGCVIGCCMSSWWWGCPDDINRWWHIHYLYVQCWVNQVMVWPMTGDTFDCSVLTVGKVNGSIFGQYHMQLETRLIYSDIFCDDGGVSILHGSLWISGKFCMYS